MKNLKITILIFFLLLFQAYSGELDRIKLTREYKKMYSILHSPQAAWYKKQLEEDYEKAFQTTIISLEARLLFNDAKYAQAQELLERAVQKYPKDRELKELYTVTAYPEIRVESKRKIISFTGDEKLQLNLNYIPDEENTDWLESWLLLIKDTDGKIVFRKKGRRAPLDRIEWNGRGTDDKPLPRGQYKIITHLFTDHNCTIRSKPHYITIADKLPDMQVSIRQKLFLPGEENINLTFYNPAGAPVKEWELLIENSRGKNIRKIEKQTSLPTNFSWDGKNDAGRIVNGGDIYQATLSGRFANGKKFESNTDEIEAALKISESEKQIRFQLYTVKFKLGKAEIDDKAYRILYLVADLLNKYDWYDVEIRGHTDDQGPAAQNLALSRKRAQSVADYLIKSCKVDNQRVKVKGMGEEDPLASNDTAAGRAQNRRVEFIMIKNRVPDYIK
ncbi:MAG TPA: OmpA family protein [Spirochaetota bacterium]|nr:OmpA family protein [Spirochaetota bacterium]